MATSTRGDRRARFRELDERPDLWAVVDAVVETGEPVEIAGVRIEPAQDQLADDVDFSEYYLDDDVEGPSPSDEAPPADDSGPQAAPAETTDPGSDVDDATATTPASEEQRRSPGTNTPPTGKRS